MIHLQWRMNLDKWQRSKNENKKQQIPCPALTLRENWPLV